MAVQTERGSHIASFNAHSSREPKFVPTAAFYAQHPELKGLFPAKQPDIQWHPKSDVYAERTKRRLQTAGLLKTLPEGWPANVEGPEVWEGKDLSANGNEVEKTSLIVYLSGENVSDLEKATNDFKKSANPTPGYVNQATFPLAERTRGVLRECTHRLYNGNGLLILRGLDPDKYSYSDSVLMYAGLTSYIGDKRGVQTQRTKEVLGHITDTGFSLDPFPLASHTNEAQPFHNDMGDILCLYMLSDATKGGDSYISSTARVYNEIAATRPDLIHALAQLWVFDTPGMEPDHHVRPILHCHNGRVTFNFARRLFTGYGANDRRSAYLPPISEAQAEVLDAVEYTAQKYKVSMKLEKGDIQLQNNLATIHGRSGFTDGNCHKDMRHLLRLWIRDEELGWEIPPALKSEWQKVFTISAEDQVWPRGPTVASVTDGGMSCA